MKATTRFLIIGRRTAKSAVLVAEFAGIQKITGSLNSCESSYTKKTNFAVLLLIIGILFFFSATHGLGVQKPVLLPVPQKATWGADLFLLANAKIVVDPALLQREQKAIEQFMADVKEISGYPLSVSDSDETVLHRIVLKSKQEGATLATLHEKGGKESCEAYQITANAQEVQVTANSDRGLYYALHTLRLLVVAKGSDSYIPAVDIEDYPALAFRGVMMDFSHGGLPTEGEIQRQIDFLARWKVNQYYFYNEVSIEMKGHSLINYNACYSQEQIKRVVAYAKEKHVDVIPFVNFYGHLHELLRMEKYSKLAIGTYGHELNPSNPDVHALLEDWIQQYVDMFPSPFVHVGFDETWETARLAKRDRSINPRELYLEQLHC